MITYTKSRSGRFVYAYFCDEGLEFDNEGYGFVTNITRCQTEIGIDKGEFLEFVGEHHDEVAVQFAESWIESREKNSLDCVINGVKFRFVDFDNRVYLECGATVFGFYVDNQQKIIDVLTENVRLAKEGML